MADDRASPRIQESPALIRALGWYAIAGCVVFAVSIVIADIVVPDHDWIADSISDLGAGRYEFIVDIGIYAYSASLVSLALLSVHVHLGEWDWSVGAVGFMILGLIIFLIGARNEYGDNDNEGVVIHIYLVYALGLLFLLIPLLMIRGARRAGRGHGRALIGLAALWLVTAPVFFFLPTDVDGLYERCLGLITFGLVAVMVRLFLQRVDKTAG